MAKTVSLNELTYSKLVVASGTLTTIMKKPVSLGMTIHLALNVLEGKMRDPEVQKAWKEGAEKMMSPERFDEYWDRWFKSITEKKS